MSHFHTTNLFFGLLIASLALGSCKQATAPPETLPPTAWKNPAVGTQFVILINATNTSEGQTTQQSMFEAFRVADSNLNVAGRHHVSRLQNSSSSLFTVMEPNGDFSIGDSSYDYTTGATTIKWTTYPLTSAKITDPPVDSVTGYSYGDTLHQRGERTNQGWTTITIGGTTFDAVKIGITQSEYENGPYGYNMTGTGTYYFVPKIGFFGKGDIRMQMTLDTMTQTMSENFEMTMYGTNDAVPHAKNTLQSISRPDHLFSPKRLLLDHVK